MIAPLSENEKKLFYTVENWRVGGEFDPPARCPDAGCGKMTERHRMREILFAVRGRYEYAFQDGVIVCEPGSVVFIGSGLLHELGYRMVSGTELVHVWISGPAASHNLFIRMIHVADSGIMTMMRSCRLPGALQHELFYHWDRLASAGTPSERDERMCCVKYALALIMDHFLRMAPAAPAQIAVEYAMEQINSDFTDVSVDSLAAKIGYSRFHFTRLFRAHFGISPHECIQRRRWQCFREMKNAHASCKEIASRLGFSSVSAFYHWRKNADFIGEWGSCPTPAENIPEE